MKAVDELGDGRLAFSVSVTPRSSKDAVVGWTREGRLKILVKAAPVDDAANRQLIKLLSKCLDVSKSDVSISSGLRSRSKRIITPGVCKNRLLSYRDI
jgi:uncharacterized protein (TIGR00251 family)